MARSEPANERCIRCRYWAERCCHALARRDHEDDQPAKCHHFTVVAVHLYRSQELPSC